ncbi:MAG: low molecular weight protein arginine phosphatase [Calditrichaeota bacterium]|nr:MAG: low molecular weight protein arginine phosphatase [Calditrichota bacterium]
MFKVLFVCTGNICRTPMAVFLLRKLIEEEGLEEFIDVDSAGTWASEGAPAAELTYQVLKENGIDASSHRGKGVDHYLMKESDLILCMASEHKRDLVQIFPHFKDKIYTLKEFGTEEKLSDPTIHDPYGMNIERYRETYLEISKEIQRIWPILKTRILQRKVI